MQPRYVLPAVDVARTINLDIKPKQAAAWLKKLPLSNPIEAAEELAEYLATANRAKIGHDIRARLAETLAPAAEDCVNALREQYLSAALPLAQRLRQNPQLAQRLLMELSTTYKILVSEWAGKTFHLGKKLLPYYLQQVLSCMQQIIQISYETHENIPAGAWVDLHQTYKYALHKGLAESIPENSRKMLSLEQIYKSTLLLALADPFHFPPRELDWAKDIITRFGILAVLFPAAEAQGQSGTFIIDVNTDSPPKPLAWEKHPTDPHWDLMLNTTKLAKHLAMLATHLRGQEDAEKLGLPAAASDPEYAVMLRRLKLNWGASVQRQSQRRRNQHGKEIDVAFGLRTVGQLISPSAPSRFDAPAVPAGEHPTAVIRCRTLDDSMGGVALHRSGANLPPVKVGDLAGVRQGNGGWSVGLVRWFRVPQEGDLFIGIQLLAPKAVAVQLRRSKTGKQWPGLLVQASPVLRQTSMLLTAPGTLEQEQQIEVLSSSGGMSVRVGKRLEYTPSVEVFRITVA